MHLAVFDTTFMLMAILRLNMGYPVRICCTGTGGLCAKCHSMHQTNTVNDELTGGNAKHWLEPVACLRPLSFIHHRYTRLLIEGATQYSAVFSECCESCCACCRCVNCSARLPVRLWQCMIQMTMNGKSSLKIFCWKEPPILQLLKTVLLVNIFSHC